MPRRGSALLQVNVLDTRSYRNAQDFHTLPAEIVTAVTRTLRLQSFYQRWRHDMFLVRDPWEILRQMQGHRVFVIELQCGPQSPESQIVAASVLWDYDLPIASGEALKAMRFLEVGTQRCILNGFNIQQILNSVIVLTSLIHDPHGIYFGAVYSANIPSIDNLLKHMDYVPWDSPPDALACMLGHRLSGGVKGKRLRCFRANVKSVHSAARCIVDLAASRVRARKQRSGAATPDDAFPEFDEIEFVWEETLYAPLLHYAERILAMQPNDREGLKAALENPSISDDFLLWYDSP
jgi:hypothetical protein